MMDRLRESWDGALGARSQHGPRADAAPLAGLDGAAASRLAAYGGDSSARLGLRGVSAGGDSSMVFLDGVRHVPGVATGATAMILCPAA